MIIIREIQKNWDLERNLKSRVVMTSPILAFHPEISDSTFDPRPSTFFRPRVENFRALISTCVDPDIK